jgi:hypothetical protein
MATQALRVPKTTENKLGDLDDHIHLLRLHLYGLQEDQSHIKALSAELRTLVCYSSGTEGLLWRLVDELNISDVVQLHFAGSVDKTHPLAQGLHFMLAPIARAGYGPEGLPPAYYSLRQAIKEGEAVFVGGQGYSHEYVIKMISQQMGAAHEDDGIEPALAELNKIFFNGVEPYFPVLAIDADLVLQVGERVLDHAEATNIYRRKPRNRKHGNLTVVVRLGLRQLITEQRKVITVRSHISEVEITCSIRPDALVFALVKHGHLIKELKAPLPDDWGLNSDAVFGLSYCSLVRQARILTGHLQAVIPVDCDLGWLDAREIVGPEPHPERDGFVYLQFLMCYERLLGPADCKALALASANLSEMLKNDDVPADQAVFPD